VATELGIGIINNADYPIEEVSDHTLALLMASTRKIVNLNNLVKGIKPASPQEKKAEIQDIWSKMIRLKDKTIGLIGFGRIARAVAVKSLALGMKVAVFDPYVTKEEIEKLGAAKSELADLIETSDFISIHTILTPETKHMIGMEQLRKMKDSAIIINTARGSIIDEKAMTIALKEGIIAGAALDATDPEPPAADSPLFGLDNVIFTGHSGHSSPESWAHRLNRPPDEVIRVMQNKWPVGLVNKAVKEKYEQRWGKMTD